MIANYIHSYIYVYNIKVQVYCVELMLKVLHMYLVCLSFDIATVAN